MLSVYFVLAFFLFPFYRYFIGSADFVTYLTIAEKYAAGNFHEAINSYWSPMISWLIVLFMQTGITPLISFKIIQITAGGVALFLIFRLFPAQNIFSVILKCALFPSVLAYAYLYGSPDLLMLTGYLGFVFILQKKIYPNNTYSSFWMGAIGSMLYFTKGFGFIFFVAAFTSINIMLFIKGSERKTVLLKKYVTGIFVFLLLSSLWIIPLSKREGKFTITSSGKYNLALISPNENPDIIHEMKHPIQRGILLPPASASDLSAWEHPDKLMHTLWNPLSSSSDFFTYLKVVSTNMRSMGHFHFGLDLGALLILILIFFYFKNKNLLMSFLQENIFLIITCFTCSMLYCLILAVHRYLWINDVVIAILLAGLLSLLPAPKKIIFFLTSVAGLLLTFGSVQDLVNDFNGDKKIYQTCNNLYQNKILNGNIASLDVGESELSYHQSSIVAYLTKNKYYGMINHDNFIESGVDEMKGFGIKYLLVWDEKARFEGEKYGMKRIFYPEINLSVYTLAGDQE